MIRFRFDSLFVLFSLVFGLPAASYAQDLNSTTVTLGTVADTNTTIPGGSGFFTAFHPQDPTILGNPCMSAGNVTFWASGTGQQGIYALRYGVLQKIADLNTLIPGGTGTFVSIPGNPCISGANVAFIGNGDGLQGVYAGFLPVQPLNVIADLNTSIPGGTGTFVSIPGNPCISGANVAFIGNGANGQQGVYARFWPVDPNKIADLNTPVPGGTGNFLAFGGWGTTPGAVISGSTVAFIGTSAGGGGIYVKVPGTPIGGIVDFNSAIPGGTGNYNRFWNLSLDGSNLAFVGGVETILPDTGQIYMAQQGVYTVAWPTDPTRGVPGTPIKVADLNTVAPGTTSMFNAFGNVAIDPQHVVFDAWYIENGASVHGLFTNLTGTLTELFDNTDSINGKPLADFSFGVGGFNSNQVVFAAQFADGSQSIATATVSGNKCPASQGYWKNHATAWPAASLILGNQSYGQAELLALLNTSTTSDASLVLARQLIAAKLNILNFSNPAPVAATISHADGLLAAFTGKLPYAVAASTASGRAMAKDTTTLGNYDSGLLTPGCSP